MISEIAASKKRDFDAQLAKSPVGRPPKKRTLIPDRRQERPGQENRA